MYILVYFHIGLERSDEAIHTIRWAIPSFRSNVHRALEDACLIHVSIQHATDEHQRQPWVKVFGDRISDQPLLGIPSGDHRQQDQ